MSRETEYTSVLDKIIIEEEIKFSEWAVEGGEQVWSTTFVIQYLIKFGDKPKFRCLWWREKVDLKFAQGEVQ